MTDQGIEEPEGSPPELQGRSASGARLMAELRQANTRAERAERELQRTRQGASYVVGALLVQAAKDPRRLVLLPRDLWRVWRLRKARRTAGRSIAPGVQPREILDRDATRLLLPRLSAVPAGRRLTIAGALSAATAREWGPYAAVSMALPQDGTALIEAIDPDIVVIDSAAALPGETWSHLGNPAAIDRLLAAGAMVDAAHALGRPVVLLRMTPPSHTAFLADLAGRCDLVVDGPGSTRVSPWHPGIDPLAWAAMTPDANGLLVPPPGESRPAAHLSQLLFSASINPVTVDPAAPVDVAWARALAQTSAGVADPAIVSSRTLGAGRTSVGLLASGRRVLSGGDADLDTLLARRPDALTAALITSDPQALVEAARRGPTPLTATEHRAALAAVLLAASAPVQLTRLAERLGIAARPRSCWDVALVADADLDVDRILSQSWRPREVITDATITARAHQALDEAGIDVVERPLGRDVDPARLGLTSTYVAHQVDLHQPHDILDLLSGALLGQPTPAHPTDARMMRSR